MLDYLGRYTHRVAISNHRLLRLEDGRVTFSWRDYRDSGASKEMTLGAEEFIRRFMLHVLPDGFQKIRYFGLMANRGRAANLALCRTLMPDTAETLPTLEVKDWKERYRELTGEDVLLCPACKQGRLRPVQEFKSLERQLVRSANQHDTS